VEASPRQPTWHLIAEVDVMCVLCQRTSRLCPKSLAFPILQGQHTPRIRPTGSVTPQKGPNITQKGSPDTQRGPLHLIRQTLGIPSAITPHGQLHQSPPSPIPGDLGRDSCHQSHALEHKGTYGQAQVCRKGHQGRLSMSAIFL